MEFGVVYWKYPNAIYNSTRENRTDEQIWTDGYVLMTLTHSAICNTQFAMLELSQWGLDSVEFLGV